MACYFILSHISLFYQKLNDFLQQPAAGMILPGGMCSDFREVSDNKGIVQKDKTILICSLQQHSQAARHKIKAHDLAFEVKELLIQFLLHIEVKLVNQVIFLWEMIAKVPIGNTHLLTDGPAGNSRNPMSIEELKRVMKDAIFSFQFLGM